MPRKKKEQLFQVEQSNGGINDPVWIRMKGQFTSKEEATEWMNKKISHGGRNPDLFRVVKEG